jgi:hypothetical protein
MTGRWIGFYLALLALSSALPSWADDQQKAEKQLRKISAMAADVTARGIVSRTMADLLNVPRAQLTRERRAMNLSYGSVFLAHQLTARGVQMLDIALQIQSHKTLFQIANEHKVDWKQIAAEARKLNGKFEDNIYKHFLRSDKDRARDVEEKYDATRDWVNADREPTQPELEEAQANYVLWRDRAATTGGAEGVVTSSEQLASRRLEDQAHDVGRITGRIPTPK